MNRIFLKAGTHNPRLDYDLILFDADCPSSSNSRFVSRLRRMAICTRLSCAAEAAL